MERVFGLIDIQRKKSSSIEIGYLYGISELRLLRLFLEEFLLHFLRRNSLENKKVSPLNTSVRHWPDIKPTLQRCFDVGTNIDPTSGWIGLRRHNIE